MNETYLTRLTLNPQHDAARRDVAKPYYFHKTLAHVFDTPDGEDYRARHGVLFRIEPPRTGSGPVVLVQSASMPQWEALSPGYALRIDPPSEIGSVLGSAIEVGRVFRFRLAANPTMSVSVPGKKNGRRIPLSRRVALKEGDRTYFDWLHDKAVYHGFEVIQAQDIPFRLAPKGTGDRPKPRLPLFGVRFDGLLRVNDPEKVRDAVRVGIGPAKAFGFGLLSVAKQK